MYQIYAPLNGVKFMNSSETKEAFQLENTRERQ